MAKKKQDDPPKGSPAWMNTFADLMNLLLCFFVLLFSMSTVNEEKFNEIAKSLSISFNSILDGGFSSIGDGQLINMGTSQLNELGELFSNMGEQDVETEGEEIKSFQEALTEANDQATQEMVDKLSELTEQYNLDAYLDMSIDKNIDGSRYVQLNIEGSLLYQSGQDKLISEALPILSQIGEVLKHFKDYRISLIGHTDNVPVAAGNKFENNEILSSMRAVRAFEYLVNVKGLDRTMIEHVGMGEREPVADNSTEEGRSKNRRLEIRIYNKYSS